MAKNWGHGAGGAHGVPEWLWYAGNVASALVFGSIALLVLPASVVSRVKVLFKFRKAMRNSLSRMIKLSTEGPFFRLMVWMGRKGACGRLSSRCSTPTAVRVKAAGTTECQVTFLPNTGRNPWHEEDYFISWRSVADGPEGKWREKKYVGHSEMEKLANNRLRTFTEGMPEHEELQYRMCAVNCWGRSDWCAQIKIKTLAKPTDLWGFTGPLGPACSSFDSGRDHYVWTQSVKEVIIKVPIDESWSVKDEIKFKVTPSRLEIHYANKKTPQAEPLVLLSGPLSKKCKSAETFWEVDTNKELGKHIQVQMCKAEDMEKWPCIIEEESHPHIDVRLVRFFTNALQPGGLDIFE